MALYEGMFLINNDAVRNDWAAAKSLVTDLIAKHGGSVQTARRWDERPLAYPIKGKHRATYLLSYFEMAGDSIPAFHREMEIKEDILRYLQLSAEAVPDEERDLTAAEGDADFIVPEPPQDTPPPIAPELMDRPREERDRDRGRPGDRPGGRPGDRPGDKPGDKPADKPAEGAPASEGEAGEKAAAPSGDAAASPAEAATATATETAPATEEKKEG
ncbi:MAG: 30S ribosomal protein S6 [Planctomycetota bacterium]